MKEKRFTKPVGRYSKQGISANLLKGIKRACGLRLWLPLFLLRINPFSVSRLRISREEGEV
jgi:hypothetical protein